MRVVRVNSGGPFRFQKNVCGDTYTDALNRQAMPGGVRLSLPPFAAVFRPISGEVVLARLDTARQAVAVIKTIPEAKELLAEAAAMVE